MSLFSSIGKALRGITKPIVRAAKPLLSAAAPFLSAIPGAGLVAGAARVVGGLASAGGAAVKTATQYPITTGLIAAGVGTLAGGGSNSAVEPNALAPLPTTGPGVSAPSASMQRAVQSPYRGWTAHYDAMGNLYYTRKHRRMNVLNPRALKRAGRRVHGFLKVARKMEKSLPHRTVHSRKH